MRVREILGKAAQPLREQPDPRFVLPKCAIGLEYEWESVHGWEMDANSLDAGLSSGHDGNKERFNNAVQLRRYFDEHTDGSLRGKSREFVFKSGYSGSLLNTAIEVMDNASRVYNFQGNHRTSLHVHMDMNDVTFPTDIEKLGALYCLCEPLLYGFVGANRDCSNFCVPWYAHSQHFEAYFGALRKARGTGIAMALRQANQLKYSGLNFFSLGNFGTVEFRHAPVTMQKDKIITWINIIQSMKKYVLENNFTPETLIDQCYTVDPATLYQRVFGIYTPQLTRVKDLRAEFLIGKSTLYHFVAASV